jgi:hypothetical protein
MASPSADAPRTLSRAPAHEAPVEPVLQAPCKAALEGEKAPAAADGAAVSGGDSAQVIALRDVSLKRFAAQRASQVSRERRALPHGEDAAFGSRMRTMAAQSPAAKTLSSLRTCKVGPIARKPSGSFANVDSRTASGGRGTGRDEHRVGRNATPACKRHALRSTATAGSPREPDPKG